MGNQKPVATGRGGRKATAQRSRNATTPAAESTRKSNLKSATPASEETRQVPRLMLNLKPQAADTEQSVAVGLVDHQSSSTLSQGEQVELPVVVVKRERTTRGGRVVKRKLNDNVVVGSELDRLDLEAEFVSEVEYDDGYEGLQADIASSPRKCLCLLIGLRCKLTNYQRLFRSLLNRPNAAVDLPRTLLTTFPPKTSHYHRPPP